MKSNILLATLFLAGLVSMTACNSTDTGNGASHSTVDAATTAVTTDEWPDGKPRRTVEVMDGDTVSISIFDARGQLTKYGEWENSQRHGASRAFYPSGTPWSEHTYEHGIQVGDYRTWYPNAQPFIVGQYDPTGKPTGVWRFFSESGELIREQPGDSIQP